MADVFPAVAICSCGLIIRLASGFSRGECSLLIPSTESLSSVKLGVSETVESGKRIGRDRSELLTIDVGRAFRASFCCICCFRTSSASFSMACASSSGAMIWRDTPPLYKFAFCCCGCCCSSSCCCCCCCCDNDCCCDGCCCGCCGVQDFPGDGDIGPLSCNLPV